MEREILVLYRKRLEALVGTLPGPGYVLLGRVLLSIAGLAGSRAGSIAKLAISEAGIFPEFARGCFQELVHDGMGLIGAILRRGNDGGRYQLDLLLRGLEGGRR